MKKYLRSRFILFPPSRSVVSVLRTLLVLTTVSFLAFLPFVSARPVQASPERTLTLMIYMCGSNLESQYGSASSDIQEILDAGYDASQVTVLIMAGGSESWHLGINPDEISILEIGKRGMRTVWKEKASSMGSSETLTRLLQFGTENYPAKDYSLILWDHGGGPMEGVCWDELFSMDNLTLQELDEALKNTSLPQKLSWIGFDACLMSSAEVALAMSPYAEYMIASQETEPAKGWNYAFLNGIETDSGGAETGKRIVDCFFDALKDSSDILTLACTDLSKAETLLPQMDAFFDPISQTLTADDFARFSNIRMASTGFGKSVRSVGEDGYDLVDLCSLVENYHTDSDDLSAALQNAIVYSRSNEEGANGLSVYHGVRCVRMFIPVHEILRLLTSDLVPYSTILRFLNRCHYSVFAYHVIASDYVIFLLKVRNAISRRCTSDYQSVLIICVMRISRRHEHVWVFPDEFLSVVGPVITIIQHFHKVFVKTETIAVRQYHRFSVMCYDSASNRIFACPVSACDTVVNAVLILFRKYRELSHIINGCLYGTR